MFQCTGGGSFTEPLTAETSQLSGFGQIDDWLAWEFGELRLTISSYSQLGADNFGFTLDDYAMLKNHHFQRMIGGGFLEAFGIGLLARIEYFSLATHKDPKVIRFLKKVRRQRRSLVTGSETYMVYSLAKSTQDLRGDIAEVGVFQGSTARVICEVKGDRHFRLFDTFEGLPKAAKEDRGVHRENQYACSLESVQSYLTGFDGLSYHKGLFPDSSEGVEKAPYSFVHFDVDLYESTLACLRYFYPLMVPGGIMLSHDYSILAGVEQACREFVADKPENLIELTTTQCMIVKLPSA